MHHTLNASIPQHLYGFVESDILQGLDGSADLDPCVVFGVTSIPSRAFHFSVMLECGAQWARIPIHKLRHERPTMPPHELSELQCWDCHGWSFAVIQFEYLREMNCTFRTTSGTTIPAVYWFTLDHTDNGFSQYPPEHKCYHFLRLADGSGQIAAMPNNRILWRDDSFVRPNPERLKRFRVMAPKTWHAEGGARNPDMNPVHSGAASSEHEKRAQTGPATPSGSPAGSGPQGKAGGAKGRKTRAVDASRAVGRGEAGVHPPR